MGDVADILGLRDGSSTLAGAGAAGKKAVDKKPEGMSREVFALLGSSSSLPSIMPAVGRMAEILARKSPATPWVWSQFANSGRADGLQLRHWQRKAHVDVADYAFARFNKKCAVVSYSAEEYALVVAPQDSGEWSKSDTDLLFRLCDDFNLSWHLIEDRWPAEPRRAVTALKARYYEVSKAVLLARRNKGHKKVAKTQRQASAIDMTGAGGAEAAAEVAGAEEGAGGSSAQADGKNIPRTAVVSGRAVAAAESALMEFTFNREHEEKREAQLRTLYSRTLEEEKEEANLVNVIRNIDANLKRLHHNAPTTKKPKASKAPPEPPVLQPFPPSIVEEIISGDGPKCKTVMKIEPGVTLRSARLRPAAGQLGVGPRLQAKMDALLLEVGAPARPVPTVKVCNAYDKLRQDSLKLLALQSKLFDVKAELAGLQGLPVPSRPGQKPKRRQQLLAAVAAANAMSANAAAAAASQGGQGGGPALGAGATKKKKKVGTAAAAAAAAGDSAKPVKKIKLKLKTGAAAAAAAAASDGTSTAAAPKRKAATGDKAGRKKAKAEK